MRAFLAIDLPAEIRATLQSLQRELGQSRADVTWVEAAQLHVTLKFLDEIDERQRAAVEDLLGRVARCERPFTLGFGSLGAFPSAEAPRVIWVGLAEGADVVVRVAEAIEREGAQIPLRSDERQYVPHVTLGRVGSPNRRERLVQRIRTVAWTIPSPWRVASLALYQSVLTSTGPRYTLLAEVPLLGDARTGEANPP